MPEAKSRQKRVWVVSYTCQSNVRMHLGITYPRIFSPSSPSNTALQRGREQCPGPTVLRQVEGGNFSAECSIGWPVPASWLPKHFKPHQWSQGARSDTKGCFFDILSRCEEWGHKKVVCSVCTYVSILVAVRREQTSSLPSAHHASVCTAEHEMRAAPLGVKPSAMHLICQPLGPHVARGKPSHRNVHGTDVDLPPHPWHHTACQ